MDKTDVIDRTENSAIRTTTFSPSRFERRAGMTLAGLDRPYTFAEMSNIPAQWGIFGPQIASVPSKVERVDYGVVRSWPDRKGFDYMSAVEVSDTTGLPAGFTTLEVPAQRYAVFPHPGHVSTLCETIDAIFSRWLAGSGFELTGTPDFLERYGEKFDPMLGSGDIEIWVPVKD